MGLFRREARAVNAQDVLAAVNLMRSSPSAPLVDADSSMRLSAVWACIRLVAGVISTFPVDQFRTMSGVSSEMPLSPLWLSPTPGVALTTWLYQLVSSGLTAGNMYGFVTATAANGYPLSVEVIDPRSVAWMQDVTGDWVSRVNGKAVDRWPAGPLWHVPLFPTPGRPYGLSPIEAARQAIGAGLSAEQFGAQFFQNGGHPNAIVYAEKQELTAEEAQSIKRAFVAATSGTREPAVFGSGLRYERVQIDPDDSQFLDSQRFTVEQIARVYGVFPEMIGGATSGSSVTYANREQRAADWLTFGLLPYLIPIEAGLSALVPRPQRVRFNVDALLRSDLKTRYDSYAVGVESGFLTVNEAREWEDLPPIDGGDQLGSGNTPAVEPPSYIGSVA